MLPQPPTPGFTQCQYFINPRNKEKTKISPLPSQNFHFRILVWSDFSGVNNIKSIPKKKLTDK